MNKNNFKIMLEIFEILFVFLTFPFFAGVAFIIVLGIVTLPIFVSAMLAKFLLSLIGVHFSFP